MTTWFANLSRTSNHTENSKEGTDRSFHVLSMFNISAFGLQTPAPRTACTSASGTWDSSCERSILLLLLFAFVFVVVVVGVVAFAVVGVLLVVDARGVVAVVGVFACVVVVIGVGKVGKTV